LTAGGLLFSAVAAVPSDTTDAQGNEGSFELFDYVLNVNASASGTGNGGVLAGIGYNPVVTSIVVANDGGKILVGYGMQTKMLALGFAISYMSQTSTANCSAAGESTLSGYNTLLPKNMNGDATSTTAITSAALCATTATWTFQASSLTTGTSCQGTDCLGFSQPFFGVVEDWANGAAAANGNAAVAEYYILGSIELATTQTLPGYGNGAYENRIMLVTLNGALLWDTGAANDTANGNCQAST